MDFPLHSSRATFPKMNFRVRVGIRVKVQDDKTCGYSLINARTSTGLGYLLCRQGCGFSLGSMEAI